MFPFLLSGRLKEHGDAVLPRIIEGLVLRLQETVTAVDANVLRCLREWRFALFALKWTEAASKTYCNY
jgi:hypothetical protein